MIVELIIGKLKIGQEWKLIPPFLISKGFLDDEFNSYYGDSIEKLEEEKKMILSIIEKEAGKSPLYTILIVKPLSKFCPFVR
jgi:hypothetical protein